MFLKKKCKNELLADTRGWLCTNGFSCVRRGVHVGYKTEELWLNLIANGLSSSPLPTWGLCFLTLRAGTTTVNLSPAFIGSSPALAWVYQLPLSILKRKYRHKHECNTRKCEGGGASVHCSKYRTSNLTHALVRSEEVLCSDENGSVWCLKAWNSVVPVCSFHISWLSWNCLGTDQTFHVCVWPRECPQSPPFLSWV